MLPLLQSVPLHIENARNHVKDSISELRRHFPSGELPAASLLLRTRSSTKRVHTGTPDSVAVIEQKRRRVDDIPTGLPSRPCSVTSEQSRLAPTSPAFTHSRQTQSPEVPLSTIHSGSARVNALRSPLADLQLSDQHSVSPSMVFKKPVRVASSRALPITPQFGAFGSSPALLGAPAHPPLSSAHTPSRASGARLHIRTSDAWGPPIPAGGRNLPDAASTHTTPKQTRKGSSRPRSIREDHSQLARPPLVPIPLPVTPVQDRLFRSGTLRSSPVYPSHVQSDMSVPPSSTGKPMSLKDRRALLPDDPVSSSHYPCHGELIWAVSFSEVRARGLFRWTMKMMTTLSWGNSGRTPYPCHCAFPEMRFVKFLLLTASCGLMLEPWASLGLSFPSLNVALNRTPRDAIYLP